MCKGSWASRHGWGWNLPSIWVCLWSGPTQEVFWDKWVFCNGSDRIQLTDYWTYDIRNTVSSFLLPTLNCIDIVFMHVSVMHEINRDFFISGKVMVCKLCQCVCCWYIIKDGVSSSSNLSLCSTVGTGWYILWFFGMVPRHRSNLINFVL